MSWIQAQTAEIHSTLGLGLAIDWGEVVPDRYQIDLKTGAVQTQSLGNPTIAYQLDQSQLSPTSPPSEPHFSLVDAPLQALIALVQRIAPGLETALELGWFPEPLDGQLVLTQARPRSLPIANRS